MRGTVDNAQLALLLEVASTPTPGNVDREREYPDLRFEHFLAGAVGAREGLDALVDRHIPLGQAFERAIAGMSGQTGGNTQFGAILLLAPLVRAAVRDGPTATAATAVVEETTVEDAVGFYGAFDHVDVAVPDPPANSPLPDVRRGSDAESALRERNLTLEEVMERSAERDGVAAEWIGGFRRTLDAADRITAADGAVTDRAAQAHLVLLADEVDTFVVTQHDRETAEEVRNRAQAILEGDGAVREFADELISREINPGTTADLIAGGLFVALESGMEV